MSNPIVSFDENAIKSDIRKLVRKTVEDTINVVGSEEADREAYRAGHYARSFTTASGSIEVAMPKLKCARSSPR